MSRMTTLIATVAGLALLAPSGRDVSAHGGGGSPTVLYQWNQILQDTIPGGGGAGAPRFYALTHIAIFDAVNAIEREFEPYRVPLADRRQRVGRRRRRRRRRTTCSSPSIRRRPPPTTRCFSSSSAAVRPDSNGRARRSAPASRRKSWPGGRTTGGSCPRSRRIPSRCSRAAGSRPRPANPRAHLHACPAGRAARDGLVDAVPAGTAADPDERDVCHRPQRGEG